MCKPNKKRNRDKQFVDDGSTIADMNVKGMPWYRSAKEMKAKKALDELVVTSKERRAMIYGAFLAYLPVVLIIIASYSLVFVLLYFFLLKH
jgi:hypothetical protein